MAFPTSLDSLTDPSGSDTLAAGAGGHAALHKAENDAIEALETKVGVNSSAVATSLDYLVKNTSSSNPGHKHTLVDGASNVTATAAELNKLSGLTAVANELNITDGGETAERVLNVNCKCRAYRNAAWTTPNNNVAKVVLDVENYDVGSDFATGTFTAPVTGYYLIVYCIYVASSLASCAAYIANSAGTIYSNGHNNGVAAGTTETHSGGSDIQYLTAGNTVELWSYTTAAVAGGTGTTQTYMSIHLLSV